MYIYLSYQLQTMCRWSNRVPAGQLKEFTWPLGEHIWKTWNKFEYFKSLVAKIVISASAAKKDHKHVNNTQGLD